MRRVCIALLSLFLAGSTVGRFISGPLCDRITADYTVLGAVVITGITMAVLVTTRTPEMIYASVFCFGLSEGATVTSRPLLIFQRYGAAGVGRLYGVATAMMTCGAFIGPVLSGYIHDKTHSYNLAVLLALVLVSISVALVFLLKRIPVSEPR